MCPILKQLSTQQQPFHEVIRIKDEVLTSKKGRDCRVLEHLLSYLEYQFGEKVAGIDYRERSNGERINNWKVEVEILRAIYGQLTEFYLHDNSLSMIIRCEMSFPLLERSLSLLNPWLIQLDLDASNQMDTRINYIIEKLYVTEQHMAAVTMNSDQLDIAEGHCQRCLAYSRRFGLEGEMKTSIILAALKLYCTLRQRQGNLSDALIFAEEAYNLVVEAYDPVHSQVQEAAGILIHILIAKGDLYDAERYAQVTYGTLCDKKNGIDQEGEEMATGAYNLANVIFKQKGDLIKAEKLARESLRIRTLIYRSDHNLVEKSCYLLAYILESQGNLGDETRGIYEHSLVLSIRNDGPDGLNTAIGNKNLGNFYYKLAKRQPTVDATRTQLLLSKSYHEEAQRIYLKIYGPTHPSTVNTSSLLTVLREI
jgi:tetratricopeptide (TPR) repeat protein